MNIFSLSKEKIHPNRLAINVTGARGSGRSLPHDSCYREGFSPGATFTSPRAKRAYTEAAHRRYKNAPRTQKSLILAEYCATTGCHVTGSMPSVNSTASNDLPDPSPGNEDASRSTITRRSATSQEDLAGGQSALLQAPQTHPAS